MNDDVLIIPIVAILLPAILVPSILILKYLARKRDYQHAERMRAIELGHPLPRSEFWPALTAIAIGGVVPFGTFFFAFLATVINGSVNGVWECAGFVGVTSVIGGTILAHRLIGRSHQAVDVPPASHAKPAFDPDAYDMIGQRY